jgi:hypothetical protein
MGAASSARAGPENPDCNPLGHPEEDASASPCVKVGLPARLLPRYLVIQVMRSSILGCVFAFSIRRSSRLGDSGESRLSHGRYPPVHYHHNHKLRSRSQASSLFASSTTCYIPSRPSPPYSIVWCDTAFRHNVCSYGPQSTHPFSPFARQRTAPHRFAHTPFHRPRIKQRSCDLSKFTPELPNHHSTPAVASGRPRGSPHHTFLSAYIIYGLGSRITPTWCSKRSRHPPSRDHFFPKNPDFFPAQILNCLPSTLWQNSMLLRQTTSQLAAHIYGQSWLQPKLTEEAFRWRTHASAW